ncbi:MAG: hypothetical protein WDW38_009907 [Sanguina aurantia]
MTVIANYTPSHQPQSSASSQTSTWAQRTQHLAVLHPRGSSSVLGSLQPPRGAVPPLPSFAARCYATGSDSSQEQSPSSSGSSEPGSSASSKDSETAGTSGPAPLSSDVDYVGPLADQHKLLKRISLSNTGIALVSAPLIIMYAEASETMRMGLAGSLVFFGLLTTGALHWVAHPYVHELHFQASTQTFRVRTSSLLSTPVWSTFQLSDVTPLPWERPVATFMAKGQFYYIDTYDFPDKDLLAKLCPGDIPPGHKDDEDDD